MSNAIFLLTTGDKGSFQEGPEPEFVRIPLNGHGTKAVKKKAEVYPGMLVADHKSAKYGEAHSSITGVVTDVTEEYVAIKAQAPAAPAEGEEAKPAEAESVNLATLSGDELSAALKGLGVDTRPLIRKCETLIINALNPEPGITWAESMLSTYTATLAAGLDVLKKLSPASRTVMAVAEGGNAALEGVETVFVKGVYPHSLDEMVTAKATGAESMQGVNVVSLHMLFNLGRVAETGKPLTETVVSVQGKNYLASIGTPLGALLNHAGLEVADGDSVIVGGPLRGEATCDLDRGLEKDMIGVILVKAGTFPPVTNHACINCGECVAHCPSRILPNLIARYAEFEDLDSAEKENIHACMECGLCGFYCTARRPVLQLIRLAKHQIALREAQVTACSLQGE